MSELCVRSKIPFGGGFILFSFFSLPSFGLRNEAAACCHLSVSATLSWWCARTSLRAGAKQDNTTAWWLEIYFQLAAVHQMHRSVGQVSQFFLGIFTNISPHTFNYIHLYNHMEPCQYNGRLKLFLYVIFHWDWQSGPNYKVLSSWLNKPNNTANSSFNC